MLSRTLKRSLRANRPIMPAGYPLRFMGSVSISMLNSLPQHKNTDSLWSDLRRAVAMDPRQLICLDDDPTGCQTVYNVNVLLDYSVDTIKKQLELGDKLFYIITNTRALSEKDAVAVSVEVVENITEAMYDLSFNKIRPLQLISRSDSTLRGHYPAEVDALERTSPFPCDATILVPAFFEGGRITVNDVHYLQEGDQLTPVGETPFAKDPHFGFKHSNLQEWVHEKSAGKKETCSISLEDIREGGPNHIAQILEYLPQGCVVVVNAVHEHDLNTFMMGLLQAEASGMQFIYRTAASFVASRAGLESKGLLTAAEMLAGVSAGGLLGQQPKPSPDDALVQKAGGLIVVGSYVPKSSRQLAQLVATTELYQIEVDASSVIQARRGDGAKEAIQGYVSEVARDIDAAMARGESVVLFTSRQFSVGAELSDTALVSDTVTDIVSRISVRPAFVIAKGGITSFDVARYGLDVRSARVLGQADPGVPVWKLDSTTRFPGVPYVVFPGNVGDDDALARVAKRLGVVGKVVSTPVVIASVTAAEAEGEAEDSHSSSPYVGAVDVEAEAVKVATAWRGREGFLSELTAAASRNCAIAAFNIYNLEGAVAVVRAAEALGSPVILQVHPQSLRFGGPPLLAMLASFRQHASVPVFVSLDHATEEKDIFAALSAGVDAIMVDGSALSLQNNIEWTSKMVAAAHSVGVAVEGELGRLTGEEDGISVSELESRMTSATDAAEFIRRTKVDLLAVTIGNVHGVYRSTPQLDFPRLENIRSVTGASVPLVLHGASGLPSADILACMNLGVCKFNVNTDLRSAALETLRATLAPGNKTDMLNLMNKSAAAMTQVASEKIKLFQRLV